MKKIKAAVVVFPGSNCDKDCLEALNMFENIDAFAVMESECVIARYDLIVLPGGFSYGDYLRAGAIASKSRVLNEIRDNDVNKLILGICNGFQMLTEAKLLPGVLIKNTSLKFVCRDISLRVENPNTPFTNQYREKQTVKFNVAHSHGNYFADPQTIAELENENRIIFKYTSDNGSANPNGSINNIAGIINEQGNILGLMPHPERSINKYSVSEDGILMFESIIKYFTEAS